MQNIFQNKTLHAKLYDSEFCMIININPREKYTKSFIMQFLLKKAIQINNTGKFEFQHLLQIYLERILPKPYNGYTKTDLYKLLDNIILENNETNNTYVIISSNMSNKIIKSINVILD